MGFFGELLGTEKVDVPGLSPTGQAIQAGQLEQLQAAGGLQQQLQPFQLAQLGLIRDEQGNLRQLTPEEFDPAQQTQALLQQRLLASLRGETPVSAGLERDIARQREILGEDIARRGQRGGTAEAQRRGAFQEAALISREQARNVQIQQAQQGLGFQQNLLSQRLAQLRGEPIAGVSLIGAGAQTLQPSLQQQQMQFQANLGQQQAKSQLLGGLGQLVGMGLTGGLVNPFTSSLGSKLGGGFGGTLGGGV